MTAQKSVQANSRDRAEDDYIFGRAGYQASARLNLQHFYYKMQAGYLLHPMIKLEGSDEVKVADIGAGTGIWILDLAHAISPAIRLDGFDISINQFPCSESLPDNVTLQQFDAFASIPDQLIGRYDVVHVRLFCTIVREDDAAPLVANLIKMLKPGVYLQWVENDTLSRDVCAARPGAQTTALKELVSYMDTVQNQLSKTTWIQNLDSTFERFGLVGTKVERFTTRPELGRLYDDTLLWIVEDYSYNFLDRSPQAKNTGKGVFARQLVAEGYEESIQGAHVRANFVIVVGRKA